VILVVAVAAAAVLLALVSVELYHRAREHTHTHKVHGLPLFFANNWALLFSCYTFSLAKQLQQNTHTNWLALASQAAIIWSRLFDTRFANYWCQGALSLPLLLSTTSPSSPSSPSSPAARAPRLGPRAMVWPGLSKPVVEGPRPFGT